MSSLTITVRIVLGSLFAFLISVGLIGNVMVCLAVYKTRRLRKKRYAYFVSLACADLVLCIFVMPFAATHDIFGVWIFGQAYCKIWYTLDIMCCTASILHLCAVSIDRYLFIHDPLRYREKVTVGKMSLILIAIWTASFAVAGSVLVVPTHKQSELVGNSTKTTNGACPEPQSALETDTMFGDAYSTDSASCGFFLEPPYAIILSSISFYIPCVVMIATYRKLYVYARNHSRVIGHQLKTAAEFLLSVATMQRQLAQSRNNPKTTGLVPSKRNRFRLNLLMTKLKKKRRRARGASIKKARITLGVTMGMFIFSWLGYFVCTLIRAFAPHLVPHWLFVALTWLGYANSAQNPIIYSIFNKDFRFAFAKMISTRTPKRSARVSAVTVYSVHDPLLHAL